MARAYPMIDGLRGIGALAIACYHTFRYGHLPSSAKEILPEFVCSVIDSGWMAVQWFFVIAGWSAVMATQHQTPTLAEFPRRMSKRLLRLAPPYWIAVLSAALLTVIAIGLWNDRSLNEQLPTWHQVAAHLLFLQDILGYDCLTTGIWFVAIAIQLEAVYLLLLGLAVACERSTDSSYPRAGWLLICFLPLALWSLLVAIHQSDYDAWFIYFFCLYAAGLLLGWKMTGRVPAAVFWTYLATMAAVGFWHDKLELYLACLAGAVIYAADVSGALKTRLSHPLPQFFGKISYCLFVIHYPVVWIVTRGGEMLTGIQPMAALFWLGAGVVASIGVAAVLQKLLDRCFA